MNTPILMKPRRQEKSYAQLRGHTFVTSIESKSQAEVVISLFEGIEVEGVRYRSGAAALAAAMKLTGGGYNRAAIYKWTWPVEKSGTGGVIPTRAIAAVERAARLFGVFIPPGALDPRGQKAMVKVRVDPAKKMLE